MLVLFQTVIDVKSYHFKRTKSAKCVAKWRDMYYNIYTRGVDMENIMVWIWLAVTIIAIVVEIITPEMVSLWFAIGGIVSIAFSFIPGLPWWGEIIIFAVISMVLLLALRPIVTKYFKRKNVATNADRIIGQEIRMITQADFDTLGSAKIGDVVWSVKSADGSVLTADEVVKVVELDGNKLIACHTNNPVRSDENPESI